jgi:AraC family transcriptional regulator
LREQEASARAQALGLGAVRFENVPELLVAGLNGTYNGQSRKDIPRQWERFAAHAGKVPGQIGITAYGVCWNTKPNGAFDYLSGVAVGGSAKLPPDFTRLLFHPVAMPC